MRMHWLMRLMAHQPVYLKPRLRVSYPGGRYYLYLLRDRVSTAQNEG